MNFWTHYPKRDYAERVLDAYIRYVESDYKKHGKVRKHWRPPRLREYWESRTGGRPKEELVDELYWEIATLYSQGKTRRELVQLVRENAQRSNPSQDVRRALERYDNKTLQTLPERDFIHLKD